MILHDEKESQHVRTGCWTSYDMKFIRFNGTDADRSLARESLQFLNPVDVQFYVMFMKGDGRT